MKPLTIALATLFLTGVNLPAEPEIKGTAMELTEHLR